MKILKWVVIISLVFSPTGLAYSVDAEKESAAGKSSGSGMGGALTGAILGGLLGGGIGTAIGSASGKAGTGALIGAGVGAVGGTLVGASQADNEAKRRYYQESQQKEPLIPKGAKIKKKVIRTYDDKGNLISEEEVKK